MLSTHILFFTFVVSSCRLPGRLHQANAAHAGVGTVPCLSRRAARRCSEFGHAAGKIYVDTIVLTTLGWFKHFYLQDIERICSLPQAVVACSIVQERILPVRALTDEEGNVTAHCSYSLLSVVTSAVANGGKKEFMILYADFASPLLTCDTFLVPKNKVDLQISLLVYDFHLCIIPCTAV